MHHRTSPPPDRRQLLLDAARTLFVQRPYEKVTTTEIARSAGVAYGLIAHHFGNKRGLYLAVMNEIKAELSATQDAPVAGATVDAQLRAALARHVDYIEANAAGFTALMGGGLGADPELRAMLDELRWEGAQRILLACGVDSTPPPALRAALRAWVVHLDEMMFERIQHHDVEKSTVVELAVQTLRTTVRTVLALDTAIEVRPEIRAFVTA